MTETTCFNCKHWGGHAPDGLGPCGELEEALRVTVDLTASPPDLVIEVPATFGCNRFSPLPLPEEN